jgi:hypothetical protein
VKRSELMSTSANNEDRAIEEMWAAGLFDTSKASVVVEDGIPRLRVRHDEDCVRHFHYVVGVGTLTGPANSGNWTWQTNTLDEFDCVLSILDGKVTGSRRDEMVAARRTADLHVVDGHADGEFGSCLGCGRQLTEDEAFEAFGDYMFAAEDEAVTALVDMSLALMDAAERIDNQLAADIYKMRLRERYEQVSTTR